MRRSLTARLAGTFRGPSRDGDAGFSLIEVMWALILFVIVASIGATTLTESGLISRGNRARVSAADLAERQIEEARATPTASLAEGTAALPAVTSNGTVFHLVQTVTRVADNSTTNACDSPSGNGQLGYKRVTVTVTWDQMGGVKPVRSDTLRALGVSAVDPTKGAIAVAVKDRNGQGLGGQLVALSPGGRSLTTGSDGCVVFADVSAASYSVGISSPGYVDSTGRQQSIQSPITVTASSIAKARFDYDQAATLRVSYGGPSGYTPPATLPITLVADIFPGNRTKAFPDCSPNATPGSCASGSPRTISNLYPTAQGYEAYAGDCSDAAPPTATQYAAVTPGQSSDTAAALAGVNVVTSANGNILPGRQVYAVHAADGSCPAGDSFFVGTSGLLPLRVALPYGTWTFATSSSGQPAGPSSKVTLTADQSTIPTATVVG